MKARRSFFIGLGVLLVLVLAVGLASASDSVPDEEPATSPFFDATLKQAVDELDGKAARPAMEAPLPPTQHYTTDPRLWPECQFGFTRDELQWPVCHFTSDPEAFPECRDIPPWPTKDYTRDGNLWDECGTNPTRDPRGPWCDPLWTTDPEMGPQCQPGYTEDPTEWPWCNPRYTLDPVLWPDSCFSQPPLYTTDDIWPECVSGILTSDPYLWPKCHYTSDPLAFPECKDGYPTLDYTNNVVVWPECPGPEYTLDPARWGWCDPSYTQDPKDPICKAVDYTQDPFLWPWCDDPSYTSNPRAWPQCHLTSDPVLWPDRCGRSYPTKDYTWDAALWRDCGEKLTRDPGFWCAPEYTLDPGEWPWCAPGWTWDPAKWEACEPGYTNDTGIWPRCGEGLYTEHPATWPECESYTGDPGIWPACHYTSDPTLAAGVGDHFPTKDYTTQPTIWNECDVPPGNTSDPKEWPECHYTSDPGEWPECEPGPELADLGDAPDSTNHPGMAMTAYPPGVVARYPTVFDPATGLPEGPKHWQPRTDAWLGPHVTLENDADWLPDEDGQTNIGPSTDSPDRDGADDGLLPPVPAPHCVSSWFTYTVTIPAGTSGVECHFAQAGAQSY